ncbi:MAG: hypothetical protein DYG86_15655 [Chloroflexi bacterium CFX2]|nr:hypothetical protein [Chloroflexi bacterium CFX2]
MKHISTKILLGGMLLIVQACGGSTPEPQEAVTQIVVIEPTSTAAAAPSEIVHTHIPEELPPQSAGHAGDQDSASTSGDHTAPGGDRFTFGEYERPFNAVAMDQYFPDLDIQFYEIFQDAIFTYASITVRSLSPEGNLPGQYALEIDTNIDGKGDFLVLVSNPSSTDWSTENAQIWEDTNDDVGGLLPVYQDKEKPGFIDGFETKVFDNGAGKDPDAAWVRISPDSALIVQIAVKTAFFDDDNKFLIGPWAGRVLPTTRSSFWLRWITPAGCRSAFSSRRRTWGFVRSSSRHQRLKKKESTRVRRVVRTHARRDSFKTQTVHARRARSLK